MILSETQSNFLKAMARHCLAQLEEYKNQKEEWLIEIVLKELYDACQMGYSIAKDEVASTPWEFIIESPRGQTKDDLSQTANQGWELQFVTTDFLIWRRRKGAAS